MNSSSKSTLTRIAEIAGIVAAIAACLALVPAFGLWRNQDNTTGQNSPPSPTQLVKTPITFVPTNFIPPTSVAENTTTPLAGEERVIGGAPMMFVPTGDFLMGSDDQGIDRLLASCAECRAETYEPEKPQHQVLLGAFWIDKYEVTNAQYKKCVDVGYCKLRESRSPWGELYYGNSHFDEYPVILVTWDDAKNFCKWAGKRLPTEAEWEKAARGIDGRIFPWGNALDRNLLNEGSESYRGTTPVGSYPQGASPYGAMDMAGNVWEWVADWFDQDYYKHSPYENPIGPSSGTSRVLRGGSWNNTEVEARSAFRLPTAGDSTTLVGFRCAKSFP